MLGSASANASHVHRRPSRDGGCLVDRTNRDRERRGRRANGGIREDDAEERHNLTGREGAIGAEELEVEPGSGCGGNRNRVGRVCARTNHASRRLRAIRGRRNPRRSTRRDGDIERAVIGSGRNRRQDDGRPDGGSHIQRRDCGVEVDRRRDFRSVQRRCVIGCHGYREDHRASGDEGASDGHSGIPGILDNARACRRGHLHRSGECLRDVTNIVPRVVADEKLLFSPDLGINGRLQISVRNGKRRAFHK